MSPVWVSPAQQQSSQVHQPRCCLQDTAQHSTAQHSTAQHSIQHTPASTAASGQHSTAQHSTAYNVYQLAQQPVASTERQQSSQVQSQQPDQRQVDAQDPN